MTEEHTWINCRGHEYRIECSRWKTYTSILKDGTKMVTGATEDAVRVCTEDIHIPFYYESDSSDIVTTKPDEALVGDL